MDSDGRRDYSGTWAMRERWRQSYRHQMKPKLLLFLPFMICSYGFLPVSFYFDRTALKDPDTLLIRHQECGCPCPNAFVKEGQLTIPDNILNAYTNIEKKEINITGNDP